MELLQHCVVFLSVILIMIQVACSKDYMVQVATAVCPVGIGEVLECNTLIHYLENSLKYFSSGSVFLLQPGLHSLHGHSADNGAFVIKDIHNLTLRGTSDGTAVVNCSGSVGLAFSNISGLTLESITIQGCTMKITNSFLAQQSMEHLTTSLLGSSTSLRAGLFLSLIWNLTLSKVSIQYCKGYGMIAVNLFGDTQVSSVNFLGNNLQALQEPICKSGHMQQNCKGGNLLLIFSDFQSRCPDLLPSYNINVYNSTFKHGVDLGPAYPLLSNNQLDTTAYLGGAGVGVSLTQTTYRVKVTIKECTLAENAAYIGANLYVTIFEHIQHSSVVVQHSRLQYGNDIHEVSKEVDSSFKVGKYTMASGFFFACGLLANIRYYQAMCTGNQTDLQDLPAIFCLQNSEISHNKGTLTSTGFVYMWERISDEKPSQLALDNCSIHDNKGSNTLSVYEFSNLIHPTPFHLLLVNSRFFSNENKQQDGFVQVFTQDMIIVNSLRYFEVVNCSFFNNSGSAIRAIDSAVMLDGINQFTDNVGLVGAGLNLQEGSSISLKPQSITIFKNNYVRLFGGAIHALTDSQKCFFQVLTNCPKEYPQLVFNNNSAEMAGNSVYGAVDYCFQIEHNIIFTEVDSLFANISTFDNHTYLGYNSPISDAPFEICFCYGNNSNGSYTNSADLQDPQYALCGYDYIPLLYSVYPGQTLIITVAALGYSGHYGKAFTPATIWATVLENDLPVSMGDGQMVQHLTQRGCSNLTYNFYSMPQMIRISLLPENGRHFYATHVNITILPCPVGFQLSSARKQQNRCICHRLLKKYGLSCNINAQTIRRTINLWVGITDYITPQAVTIGDCPSTYCNRDRLLMSINYTDEQCMPHRSGILCGSCQQGYSVAIGSAKCLQCSNYYLFFLILFAIFGVLLILFLSVTNLTTATGMINALLFYASIIKIVNLPKYTYGEYIFLDIASVFINWLNLDFGIETCLYDGLNAYVKAWLQYMFPLYLFFLLFLLTIVSNRSIKVSKILPPNIIAVFATVVLISYTKLLRNTQLPLPNVQLSTLNNSYMVWRYDGSIVYFGIYHASLVIFSLLVFLGVILPYTVLLFIHPFLQKMSTDGNTNAERFFSWIRHKLFHLKPFFDAYEAPYKPSHQYWTGLLLGLRIVIMFSNRASQSDSNGIQATTPAAVTAISCVLLIILLLCSVYTSKLVIALEFAHYINLAMLEFVSLILLLSESSQNAKAIVLTFSISFSFSLCTFSAFIPVFRKLKARYPRLNQWSTNLQKNFSKLRKKHKKFNKDIQVTFLRSTSRHKVVTHSSVFLPMSRINHENGDMAEVI